MRKTVGKCTRHGEGIFVELNLKQSGKVIVCLKCIGNALKSAKPSSGGDTRSNS